LPNRLAPALENMEAETQQEILREVTFFAVIAEKMLTENVLGLCVLLTHKGQKREEKNDLEKLVEYVKEKRV